MTFGSTPGWSPRMKTAASTSGEQRGDSGADRGALTRGGVRIEDAFDGKICDRGADLIRLVADDQNHLIQR